MIFKKPVKFKLNANGTLGERELLFDDESIAADKMMYYDSWLYYTRTGNNNAENEDFGLYRAGLMEQAIIKLVKF